MDMSIFRKKHSLNTALVAVDLLALLLLVFIALFVLSVASRSDDETALTYEDQMQEDIEVLTRNYLHEVDALLEEVQEQGGEDHLERIQSVLIDMRVPAHMQEAHLTAVLSIGRLIGLQEGGDEQVNTSLAHVLTELARRY